MDDLRLRARSRQLLPGTVGIVVVLVLAISSGALGWRQGDSDACQSNLKQFALGMLMYCQDYDELLPPMKTPDHVVNRVAPYVRQKSVFSCPTTNTRYLPNPALNYGNIAEVGSPATMLLLRDAKPHKTEEGKSFWNVAFVDGHVKQVSSEPKLGKLAPQPQRSVMIARQLASLRKSRKEIDAEIRKLEAEQRRLRRRR